MAYKQAKTRNQYLKRTYEEMRHKRYSPSGVYFDEKKHRYIKCSLSNTPGLAKSFRKVGNKKVRKSEDLPRNPSYYRKIFDYKWTIM